MVVIDLFSGAGGLTEGFFREGFKIIAHVEKERWACETLKTRICYHFLEKKKRLDLYYDYLNQVEHYEKIDEGRKIIFNEFPELKEKIETEVLNKTFGENEDLGETPVHSIIPDIEKSMELNNVTDIDVIIGGPPCQAYSLIGRGRMKSSVEDDNRNYLFRYYKEIVMHFKPKIFIFENVPGIITAKGGEIFPAIKREFEEINYVLRSGPSIDDKENILEARKFGVYQSRKRVILFGYCKDIGQLEYPDFYSYTVFKPCEEMSTKNAIGDLPALKHNSGNDFLPQKYPQVSEKTLSEYQKLLRDKNVGAINHKSRKHSDRDLEIYKLAIEKAKKNIQLRYCELEQGLKTHKNEKSFEDRFKVHRKDSLPHTIVAHMSKDGHYNIHYDKKQCRSLTVREAARIQSFPDNYKFEGPRTWQYVQVGNAVPPLMSQAIARAVWDILRRIKDASNFGEIK